MVKTRTDNLKGGPLDGLEVTWRIPGDSELKRFERMTRRWAIVGPADALAALRGFSGESLRRVVENPFIEGEGQRQPIEIHVTVELDGREVGHVMDKVLGDIASENR
ncbi:MAG: hypothetical protein L0177_06235 [Chloroflexi bacterium]|nr:hypothetical protein [Chloroflexota bacterium]